MSAALRITDLFMLAQLRAVTRNWIARVLLGVIALAMAITLFQGDFISGLTNMFNPQGVAQVGSSTITPRELQREFDLFLRGQQQQGRTVTRPQALEANIHLRILESLIERRAMHQYAAKLGVHTSDAQAADQIREIPAAKNQLTGRFDRASYERFLSDLGYSAGEFETEIRNDIAANQIMMAASAGVRVPSSFGALALAYESERRIIDVAQAPGTIVGDLPEPTPAQIQAFYEDHRGAFAVPEFRGITVIVARAQDFADRVSVPEERVRAEFDQRRNSLSTPEKRSFVQIAAPDETKARDAATRLSNGQDPQAIASALGLTVVRQADKAQTDIADPAIRQAVFAMQPGAGPQVVRGQLSPFAVVRLESVTQASAPTYESARESLRGELAAHEGADMLDRAIEAFEQARDGGANAADAARAQGLTAIVVPAVSAQGRAPNGQPIEELVDLPSAITTAFQTQEGEATDFTPMAEGADVLVQVDRVTPATTRPLDQVRPIVIAQWVAQERGRRLREIGDRVSQAVTGGQSFAEAIRAANLQIAGASQAIDRQMAQRLPDPQLAQAIFGAAEGQVTTLVRPDGGAVLVVHVQKIERADPTQNQPAVEQLRQQIQQQVGQSLVAAVQSAAIERARVKRNQRIIDQLFPPAETGEAQQ
ncbi:MAG: SurA N-terminal domain-containing protein [Caulobacterales bacterium]